MRVNAKEFRQHLGEYLHRAARGQTFEVSVRGKSVACVSRIDQQAEMQRDDLFGIWADMDAASDVSAEVRDMRKGRCF